MCVPYIIEMMLYGVVAYIVGSIPTGFLIARLVGIQDITQHGSGTMGATNVARVASPYLFFIVLLFDAGKAAVLLWSIPQCMWPFCMLFLMLGNTRSIFMSHFGGGKGVATLLGIMAVISLKLLALFVLVWLGYKYGFGGFSVGRSSTSALIITFFFARLYISDLPLLISFLCVVLWSVYMHRSHICSVV